MSTAFCPCCHRPLPPSTRHGVVLSVLKASLFDYIVRHPGLSSLEIGAAFGRTSHNIRVHVQQINRAFDGTGISLEGAKGWGYCMRRRRRVA